MSVVNQSAQEIIERLGLQPHPEGGHFRETWRHHPSEGGRGAGTAIYFLLSENQRSHWHRVDAVEIWHFYGGAPLELHISTDGIQTERWTLGPQLGDAMGPQFIVPADAWQSARSTGPWTLVGCTVSPAFDFAEFELAPTQWSPGEPNAHDSERAR